MKEHLLLTFTNGELLYQIFYLLAFIVASIILIYEGYNIKFPLLPWIPMVTGIRMAVVIGYK